ncbi:MAG: lipopolysaccharide biosynthesis protein [Muribaculaceae bacterium]|nr:lipopolysaccharide biosynthesis protein [Muribaculaceae bacterium]MDE6843361.1 lipopolysaccharide biosynthesis protein [Muribaculaceae bacterium]
MEESLKHRTVKGTIWSSIERFSVQGILFIVTIIMARLLTPADYGLVGMLAIFIAVSQSLIDSGFSQALIRKQDRSEIDNSTVFYFNIVVGIILYIILYLCAPLIAKFYSEPKLVPITRLIGLNIIFNSLAVVQRALLTIRLDFKTQAKASLIGAIVSGIIGIIMAYTGFGVWAIVTQQIFNLALVTLFLWLLSHWKPILIYSWDSFRELFSFGSKLLGAGLLDTLYRNLYLIVIGKIFRASDLGYYTRAHQFSDFASSNVTGILQRVSYPVLCTIQNDDERLANVYRRMLRTSTFIIFPMMMLLAAVSRPLVLAFLTEKWLFASTLLIPLCFGAMWYPVHAINLNLLQVKGRSDLFLRLEIIKKCIGIMIICVTIPFGLLVMCWGTVVNSVVSLIINTYYTGKIINLGFLTQMRDILPILFLSLTVGAMVFLILNFVHMSSWLSLLVGIVIGIILYSVFAKILHFKEFSELIAIIHHK